MVCTLCIGCEEYHRGNCNSPHRLRACGVSLSMRCLSPPDEVCHRWDVAYRLYPTIRYLRSVLGIKSPATLEFLSGTFGLSEIYEFCLGGVHFEPSNQFHPLCFLPLSVCLEGFPDTVVVSKTGVGLVVQLHVRESNIS